jgi:hypothetical protein
MRTLFGRLASFAIIAVLLSISLAVAAEGDRPAAPKAPSVKEAERPADGSPQSRMKTCNAEAAKKSLKGEERKAFMSACLRQR